MSRVLFRFAAVLVLLGAGAAYLAGRPQASRPNVLLVTIDTLRPDAVGEGKGTPAIDGFVASATRFRRARSVAPLTLTAHMSMFTGLSPAAHAIHDNVTTPLPPREHRPFPLIAEELKDAGYRTAAFVASAALAPASGVAGGFDLYDCPTEREEQAASYVPGEKRVLAAVEWIRSAARDRPWFVWVHLYDPHAPYHLFPGDDLRPATRDRESLAALYAGEVCRADAALGALLASIDRATVVLVASDHGEGLGEHGEAEHGPLCYGATIDAFLAVRAPGFRPGTVDDGLRSLVDVAPTLRSLCGLPSRTSDGSDLAGPPHGTLVAESLIAWRMHGWGQCFSVTDGVFTLVESGSRLELFDRRTDPHETRPLPLTLPAYEKLDRALEGFRSSVAAAAYDGDPFTSIPAYGTLRRHVSGYLPRHENAKLRDPRAHLAAWMSCATVPGIIRMALQRRDPRPLNEALRRIARLEKEAPGSPRIPYHRAAVYGALGQLTGERSWLSLAAWAELDAIGKGYADPGSVRMLIGYATASGDREVVHALGRERAALRLDRETAAALARALVWAESGSEPSALRAAR